MGSIPPLLLGVEVDISPLISGMNEAGTVVSSAADRMAASFMKASLSSTDAASAMKNLGFSAAESATALKAVGYEAEAAAAGNIKLGVASAEARVELAALTGSAGAAEFGLARLAAMSGLGPVIANIFPVFAALAFVEIADQAVGKVEQLYQHFISLADQEAEVTTATNKLSESTYEYTQRAQQAYESTLGMLSGPVFEAKQKLQDLSTTVYPLHVDDKEIKDLPKHVQQFIDGLKTAPGQIGVPAEQIAATIAKVNDELKQQQAIAAMNAAPEVAGPPEMAMISPQEVHQAQINARLLQGLLDNLTAAQRDYAAKTEQLHAGVFKAQESESSKAMHSELADEKEKYTATEQLQLASIESNRAALQAKFAANQISAQEEIKLLQDLDAQKNAIEKTATERQAAAAAARKAQEAESKLAEQELRDQSELATYSKEMARADLEAIKEKIRAEQDLALASIRGVESVAAAQARADEAQAARDLRDKKITPEQEGAVLGTDETKRHQGKVEELNELAGVEQDPAKLAAIHAELEAEEITFRARMKQIADDAASKTNEAQLKSYDSQISAATESANRQLEVEMRADEDKAKHHEISTHQEITAETAALSEWYARQATMLNTAEAFAAKTYGKDSEQYAALVRKKEQLDEQYAAKTKQITQQVENAWEQLWKKSGAEFNSTMTKLITGEETWAQASKTIYAEVANQFIENSLKMLEQAVVAELTHKALLKTEILGDAKTAAAGAFRWVMQDVPFPANAVLAPAAAAAAFAGVMAFGSFQAGGVVPTDNTMAILHAQEMVLPSHISTGLQQMISNNSTTTGPSSQTTHFNQENHFHKQGDLTEATVTKLMRKAARHGSFPRRRN